MIKTAEILKQIEMIDTPRSGFNLIDINGRFWGKTQEGGIVFAVESIQRNVVPMAQSTKCLKLFINTTFLIANNGQIEEKNLSALVLAHDHLEYAELFVRLSASLSDDLNEDRLLRYFIDLKDLFSNTKRLSQAELQGLFGELFFMYVSKVNYGIDFSVFYQKEDRRKFDFSVSDKKKIEIKSTIKPERIHHFLKQQLDTDSYDIKVVSLMLQKDDAGMSMLDLISESKDLFANNLSLVIHIESMIKNCSDDELASMRFNYDFAKDNLKIFDALNVPRLKEKNDEGVFNVEFDADLTNSQSLSMGKLIDWLKQGNPNA